MIVMRCPWESPPLRSNDNRMHWAKRAKLTKQIRQAGKTVAVESGVWFEGPVVVSLIWEVTDRRRRDVGAASPTLKAWIDGLVDGGLFMRDSHDVVAEERLRIEYGTRKGVRVEIAPTERKDTTT